MKTEDDGAIYMMLLLRPDHVYIAPGGKKMYILTSDQEDLIVINGVGFDTMSEAEINFTIQKVLEQR